MPQMVVRDCFSVIRTLSSGTSSLVAQKLLAAVGPAVRWVWVMAAGRASLPRRLQVSRGTNLK